MCNVLKRFFAVILAVMLISAFFTFKDAQAGGGKTIPIFPGADLEPPGSFPECCLFSAKLKSYEKVVAFYENYFKTKAMDSKAMAKKYPDEGYLNGFTASDNAPPGVPGVKETYFPIEEVQTPDGKIVNFLWVQLQPLGVGGKTIFLINEQYLGPDWLKRKEEMSKKHEAQMAAQNEAFKEAGKEVGKNMQAIADNALKGELDRINNLPAAKPGEYNLPVYKGSHIEITFGGNYRNSACYTGVRLYAFSPVDKVVSFYKEKLGGKLKISDERKNEEGKIVGIDFKDTQFRTQSTGEGEHIGALEVWGKRGNVNKSVRISPHLNDVIAGVTAVVTAVEITSETLDEKCALDPGMKTIWHDKMPKD